MANPAVIATWVGVALMAILTVLATHRFPRTKGRKPLPHLIFGTCAAVVLLLFPHDVQEALFSPLGVTIVGAMFPIYESVRAVCTPQTDDDTSWLQYWCAQGGVYFTAAYLSDYALCSSAVQFQFRRFEFFFFLWLLLPFTDGSTLTFDFVANPLLAPVIKPAAAKMGNWISALTTTFVNAAHLWVLWVFFMFLPAPLKRFVMIATGTAYPLLASIVAVTTSDTDDDTVWLTYWSCYGSLFLIVDWAEHLGVGRMPGFYAAVLCATVYLMLPMFDGAEKAFRHVLAPVAGLKEVLLVRDAVRVKRDLIRNLPPQRRAEVRRAIAKSFVEDGDDAILALTGSITKGGYGSVGQDCSNV